MALEVVHTEFTQGKHVLIEHEIQQPEMKVVVDQSRVFCTVHVKYQYRHSKHQQGDDKEKDEVLYVLKGSLNQEDVERCLLE